MKPYYKSLVKKAASFMVRYRDPGTGLPGLSYDLWEERRGISGFTVAAVFGGLAAASVFCTVFGEDDRARVYRQAASDIRDAASKTLWRPELGRFCRMLYRNDRGELEVDGTCDSSLWGLFAFGLYTVDDPRIESTMKALEQKLWISTETGGMARYENDSYYRADDRVPGNPWFLSTLWLADYYIEKGQMEEGLNLLRWVEKHALPSGVLSEQVHPQTGEPLSVSPLTWSHATFVATTRTFVLRAAELAAGAPPPRRDDWLSRLFTETCSAIHGACKVK